MPPKRNRSRSTARSPGTASVPKRRRLLASSSVPAGALRQWRAKDAGRRRELQIMRELRAKRDAPVDAFSKEAQGGGAGGKDVRTFQVLVSVFLSSQTRDEVTSVAIVRLKQNLPGGLTLDSVLRAREAKLAALLKPVAFYNTKAKQMKRLAHEIKSRYNCKVPSNAEELQSLPGIGPKMAHVVVVINTKKSQGVGVDVHVHRICNKLGWVKSSEPEQTQTQLQRWLPYPEWAGFNLILVGLGQQLNSARPTLLRRCLGVSKPLEALHLLERLGLDISSRDKVTGEGLLHFASRAGCLQVLRVAAKRLKVHRDKQGRLPWDGAPAAIQNVFGR